jgi:hypothetical protein
VLHFYKLILSKGPIDTCITFIIIVLEQTPANVHFFQQLDGKLIKLCLGAAWVDKENNTAHVSFHVSKTRRLSKVAAQHQAPARRRLFQFSAASCAHTYTLTRIKIQPRFTLGSAQSTHTTTT